jgi:hypothetical protein
VNNHFFDDFTVGPIPVDVTPPSILSVTATSATNVDVLYDEALDPGFIGGYDIIPFIGVSGQTQDGIDPALVHVHAGDRVDQRQHVYPERGPARRTLAGNASPAANIDFTYFVPEVAGPGMS